jgi:hypothetical protein
MNGNAFAQTEIIGKSKNTLKFKKKSSAEPECQFQSNLVSIILGKGDSKLFK